MTGKLAALPVEPVATWPRIYDEYVVLLSPNRVAADQCSPRVRWRSDAIENSLALAIGGFVAVLVVIWCLSIIFSGPASAAPSGAVPVLPSVPVTSSLSSLVPSSGPNPSGSAALSTPPSNQTGSPVGAVVAPVTNTVAPVAQTLTNTVAPVLAPVTNTVAPVVAPVTNSLAPVTNTVAPVVAPVTNSLAPVTNTVTNTVAPVAQTLTNTVAPVLAPAIQTVAQTLTNTVTPGTIALTSVGGGGGVSPPARLVIPVSLTVQRR